MHILVITNGARGDVQPYLHLATGLVQAGHTIRFATMERFGDLVAQFGFEYVPLQFEPLRALAEALPVLPGGIRWQSLRNRTINELDAWWQASKGMDCIVAHPLIYAASDVAAGREIPLVYVSTLPVQSPTAAFPNSYLFSRSLGTMLNRLSYGMIPAALAPAAHWRKQWRKTHMPDTHIKTPNALHLHAWSAAALPRPQDWPANYLVTGFMQGHFVPDRQLIARITKFLSQGSTPIYVGFGSATGPDPDALTRKFVQALQTANTRAIVARGSGTLNPDLAYSLAPELVFPLRNAVPHSWLFNQVAAIVHHGGPGTFGSALAAGKPQWICPVNMDQPFWGNRAHALGVGPSPIKAIRLSAESITRNLVSLQQNKPFSDNASRIAAVVAAEDGVQTAVQAIASFAAA